MGIAISGMRYRNGVFTTHRYRAIPKVRAVRTLGLLHMVGGPNLLIGVTHHLIVRYEGIYPYSISDAVDIPRLGTLPPRRSKQANPHCATFGTKCKDRGKVFLHPQV